MEVIDKTVEAALILGKIFDFQLSSMLPGFIQSKKKMLPAFIAISCSGPHGFASTETTRDSITEYFSARMLQFVLRCYNLASHVPFFSPFLVEYFNC